MGFSTDIATMLTDIVGYMGEPYTYTTVAGVSSTKTLLLEGLQTGVIGDEDVDGTTTIATLMCSGFVPQYGDSVTIGGLSYVIKSVDAKPGYYTVQAVYYGRTATMQGVKKQ